MNFHKVCYKNDLLEIGDATFSLGQRKQESLHENEECFVLWKDQKLLAQYEKYFSFSNKAHNNILELGMWDGGSTALWYELLAPKKIIGIDILDKKDTNHFANWKHKKIQEDGSIIKTFWNTSQTDIKQLQTILKNEFPQGIDIVFDDASHHYSSTIISFETVFPLLKPGAIYIIEDWAWLHWKEWVHSFPKGEDISRLIYQMIQSAGTYSNIIESVTVYPGFTVIERGTKILDESFKLQDHIFLPVYNKKTFRQKIKAKVKTLLS
jgi:SAM-dependent methyltransferase